MNELSQMSENAPVIDNGYAKLIFKALTGGEVINKHIFDKSSGTLVTNPLYAQLIECESSYRSHYKMMGYYLKNAGEYFYLYDEDVNIDDKQASKTKVYAAIILLVRFVTQERRYLYDVLTNVNYGIGKEELVSMTDKPEYRHILNSSKLETVEGMLKVLIVKNMTFQLPSGKYLLTNAGKQIVEDIIQQHSDHFSENDEHDDM